MQRYKGLNLWDQLSVDIEVSGDMPSLPEGSKPYIDDFVDEFTLNRANSIQSYTSLNVHLDLENGETLPDIPVTINQDVSLI